MPKSVVKFRVLGETSAEVNGRPFGPDATHVFAALLILALQPQHRVTRQRLATLLWYDAPSIRRGERLRSLLSKMRGLGVPLDVTPVEVTLSASVIDVDYVALLSTLDVPTPDRFTRLDDMGAVLSDYAPDFSPPFRRWVDDQRESIADEMLTRLVPLLGHGRQRGDWAATERIARAIRRMSRLHEEATLALAEALCARGDKAHGIQVLDDYLTETADSESPLRLPAELLRRRISMAAPADDALAAVPFVGRREQLHRFQTMFARAAACRGGALLVAGPPGIGKTRLLHETAAFASTVGQSTVVRVRCQPGDATRPLSGISDVIAKLLELRGAAGCAPRTLERLARLGELEEPASAEVSAVHDGDPQPAIHRDELREALLDLLAATSEEQALVVQIDDFQWSDRSMGWLWASILPFASSHRLLWCFAARCETPQDMDTLFASDMMPSITSDWLTGLDVTASAELLDGLLSRSARKSAAAARQVLLERGGGIPLVLLEVVRHWQGTGELSTVPLTLAALMDARLARLSPAARRTLQVSALLGTSSSIERLERVLQFPRPDFVDALATLEIRGILTTDQNGATHGHALWADAAVAHLEPSVARVLHRHIAEYFDLEMATTPSSGFLWESARHWELGGHIERALAAIVRGAEHLARNGLYLEAAEAYERAVNRSGDATQQRTYIRRRIDLLRLSGVLARVPEEVERHERLAVELDPLYDRHNDLELVKRSAINLTYGVSTAIVEEAVACARAEHASASHRIQASFDCIRYGGGMGLRDVADDGYRMLVALTPLTADDRQYHALGQIYYQADFGDQHRALEIAREWMAFEQNHGDAYRLAWSARLVGWSAGLAGDLTEARRALHESIRVAREARLSFHIFVAHSILVSLAIEYTPPNVMRQAVEASWLECEPFADHLPLARPTFALQSAIVAIEEGNAAAALRHLSSAEGLSTYPSTGADYLAVQLAARMLTSTSRAADADMQVVADELGRRLAHFSDGVEWSSGIYAEYLDKYLGSEAADEFVRDFLELMRTLLPPRRLAPFVARIRQARESKVSPERGHTLSIPVA